jgi:type III pantothenate kinase
MNLVIDLGTHQIKAALFEGDNLVHAQVITKPDQLVIKDRKIDKALLAAKDGVKKQELMTVLISQGISCQSVEVADFSRLGNEDTRSLLAPDKIANIFGALYHFPLNDCVIVDLRSTVSFDYVTKRGVYLGGATFPDLGATPGEQPESLGKTKTDQSKSGSYFGLLGAIERIVAELRLSSEIPSEVMVVATGGRLLSPAIKTDLADFTDRIDPHLTLVGLNQILKERG